MGRKKKKDAKRLPCGRINQRHQAFEEGPEQTVLQARRRHLRGVRTVEADKRPVSKDQVKSLKLRDRGSILGGWMADGKLTREEVQIGEDYCARYLRYAALTGLPRVTAQIGRYGEAAGMDRSERLNAAMAAKSAHMEDQRRLRHCSAGVRWAIKRACVLDEAAPIHLVKEGLDALAYAK